MGRYASAALVGAVLGFGWWGWFRIPDTVCSADGFGCQIGWLLTTPAIPVASWLVAWAALHRLRVSRPGATGATGVAVAVVLWLTGLGPAAQPYWYATPAVGTLALLIGGALSSQPAP